MSGKGRFLEVLVRQLESFLSVEGIIIQSPERFFSKGKPIGEIDITLRGAFGSSRIFVGIECRDRPSNGPQGLDWIRTIRGKQDHLKVDKMIAVSTTGFTDDAIDLAKEFNIDLLTLNQDEIGHGKLVNWVRVASIKLLFPQISFRGDIEIATNSSNNRQLVPSQNLFLLRPGIQGMMSVQRFVEPEIADLNSQFIEMNADEWTTFIKYEGPVKAIVNGKYQIVNELLVPINFKGEILEVKMVMNAYKRLNDGEILAMTGIAHVTVGPVEHKVIALQKTIEGTETLSVSFVTMDNKPFNPDLTGAYVIDETSGKFIQMTPNKSQ